MDKMETNLKKLSIITSALTKNMMSSIQLRPAKNYGYKRSRIKEDWIALIGMMRIPSLFMEVHFVTIYSRV